MRQRALTHNACDSAVKEKRLATELRARHLLVPVVGVEPTRHCWQRILSPPRLPIPTYRLIVQLESRIKHYPRRTAVSHRAGIVGLERIMGVEPTTSAWEANVLPINYIRKYAAELNRINIIAQGSRFVKGLPKFFPYPWERTHALLFGSGKRLAYLCENLAKARGWSLERLCIHINNLRVLRHCGQRLVRGKPPLFKRLVRYDVVG